MIADKALQIANNLSAVASPGTGLVLTDVIDLLAAGTVGSGCPLYCQITIRSDFTEASLLSTQVRFLLKSIAGSSLAAFSSVTNQVAGESVFESGAFVTLDLVKGRKFHFAISPHNYTTFIHPTRGMRYLVGMVTTTLIDGGAPTFTPQELTGGAFDWDFVLNPDPGSTNLPSAGFPGSDQPYYPTGITRV